jgi:hypothetical protein
MFGNKKDTGIDDAMREKQDKINETLNAGQVQRIPNPVSVNEEPDTRPYRLHGLEGKVRSMEQDVHDLKDAISDSGNFEKLQKLIEHEKKDCICATCGRNFNRKTALPSE